MRALVGQQQNGTLAGIVIALQVEFTTRRYESTGKLADNSLLQKASLLSSCLLVCENPQDHGLRHPGAARSEDVVSPQNCRSIADASGL